VEAGADQEAVPHRVDVDCAGMDGVRVGRVRGPGSANRCSSEATWSGNAESWNVVHRGKAIYVFLRGHAVPRASPTVSGCHASDQTLEIDF
jgi:hypothetical protein